MTKKLLAGICSSLFILSSCGGTKKVSSFKANTLNNDNKFVIEVPVVVAYEAQTYFKFQEGYSIEDIKKFLDTKNCYYEENNNNLFFNTIIDNKSEYFLISSSNDDSTYCYTSTAYNLNYKNSTTDRILIPYFLLKDKTDYNKIKDYFCNQSQKELIISITFDYQNAKLLFLQTAQKEMSFDDENKKITIYNKLEMIFSSNYLTYNRLF